MCWSVTMSVRYRSMLYWGSLSGSMMNRGCMNWSRMISDCWCSVIGTRSSWGSVKALFMTSSITSISGIVMTLGSVSISTISVMSTKSVMSPAGMSTDAMVCTSIADSVFSWSGSVVIGNSVMPGLFIICVSFFVSGTLKNRKKSLYNVFLR